jgi:hypothetical protein
MKNFALDQVGDDALERSMLALFADDRRRLAQQIAHIAEFDARRLYAREGFSSMFDYCVGRARLSDDAALKRIRAARAARAHPVLFQALADGRLHLTAIVRLAPKLTAEIAGELVDLATHKTVAEIDLLIASRFPRNDVPLSVQPVGSAADPAQVVSKPLSEDAIKVVSIPPDAAPRARVAPLSPGRFEARFTMGQETREVLVRLEELLGRRLKSDDLDTAVRRGLEAMVARIEKRRYAATERPRAQRKPARGRHIPAAVKRAVRERDGDRCTFIAENGRRCEARGRLEYDHIEPVARGGRSTVANLRLRCRAHNQYEAEQAFGEGFMNSKREAGRDSDRTPGERDSSGHEAADTRSTIERSADDPAATVAAQTGTSTRSGPNDAPSPKQGTAPATNDFDLTPCLERLGFRKQEVRLAAEYCQGMPDASIEARVRAALAYLRPPARVSGARTNPASAG